MPYMEYECILGHRTEQFYKTISAAEDAKAIACPKCSELNSTKFAVKVPSRPLEAHLYGNPEGYHKPGATKRFNTKTVSQKDGNKYAAG
jgi:hypothetical protein